MKVAVLRRERQEAEAQKFQRMSSRFHIVSLGEPRCENSFRYFHQRSDGKVDSGMIPSGFLSYIDLFDDEAPLFLQTGVVDIGFPGPQPAYQVMWTNEKVVIGDEGWSGNLDMLWCKVLRHFDKERSPSGERLLSESTLNFLDADPFILFGINNLATQ